MGVCPCHKNVLVSCNRFVCFALVVCSYKRVFPDTSTTLNPIQGGTSRGRRRTDLDTHEDVASKKSKATEAILWRACACVLWGLWLCCVDLAHVRLCGGAFGRLQCGRTIT